jgi:hypothetical protein
MAISVVKKNMSFCEKTRGLTSLVKTFKTDGSICNAESKELVTQAQVNNTHGTCIGTIVIYELITRKSQITTEKCI